MEKQYTIGEFAALNKITSRMLRHYDKIGLLKPSAMLENGYRAYTSEQIPTVSKIRLFQRCHFTLSEIAELLHASSDEVLQAAKAKMTQLGQQEKDELLAKEQLILLTGDLPSAFANSYDISFTQQPELLLFCSSYPVTIQAIETAFEQLYSTLNTLGGTPSGLLLMLVNMDKNIYRVAVPVCTSLSCREYESVPLAAGWYLSTLHYGDYSSIGAAYDRLLCYAQEHHYELTHPFIERYFIDSTNTLYPTQYVTQILIQLTP